MKISNTKKYRTFVLINIFHSKRGKAKIEMSYNKRIKILLGAMDFYVWKAQKKNIPFGKFSKFIFLSVVYLYLYIQFINSVNFNNNESFQTTNVNF